MDNETTIAPHLTGEQLENYLSDTLDDAQRHQVEKHLLSCALCTDAIEGLTENTPAALSDDLTDLERRLKQRIDDQKKGEPIAWPYYRAAAVVVLLMLSGVVFYFLSLNNDPLNSELAIDQKELAPTSDETVIDDEISGHKSTEGATEVVGESRELISTEEATGVAGESRELIEENDGRGKIQPTGVQRDKLKAANESPAISRSENIAASKNVPQREEPPSQLADTGVETDDARAEEETKTAGAAEVAAEDAFGEAQSPSPEVKTRPKLAYKPLRSKRGDALPQAIVPPDPYRTIVGKVISSESGRPLAGIKIEVKDTKIATFTDNEGDYILAAPLEAQALVMTFQGYTSQELPLELDYEEAAADFLSDTLASGSLKAESPGDSLNLGISNYTLAREDTEPIPEGGMEAYVKYLATNESIDEKQRRFATNLATTVEVSFTVQADGNLTDFELTKESPDCKDIVIGKIQKGPKWVPGTTDAQKAAKRVILSVPCDL
ncbi:MAG: carboxypeptidase-like regulatory domain-containing protein [Cyclobacteriaceae bacterium]